jgi:hypothetical protein
LGPGNHSRIAFETAAGGLPLEEALFNLTNSVSEPFSASPLTPGSDDVLVKYAAARLTGIAAHQAGKKYLQALKGSQGPPSTLTVAAGQCAASISGMQHLFPMKESTRFRLAARVLRALGRHEEEEHADEQSRVAVDAMLAKRAQGKRLSVDGDTAQVLVTITLALPMASARGGGGGEFGPRSLQSAFASTVSAAVETCLTGCTSGPERLALLAAETASLLDVAVLGCETAAGRTRTLKAQLDALRNGPATEKAELDAFAARVDELAYGVLKVCVVGGRAKPANQINRKMLRDLALEVAPNLLRKLTSTVNPTTRRPVPLHRRQRAPSDPSQHVGRPGRVSQRGDLPAARGAAQAALACGR